MNNLEITGTIIQIQPLQEGTSKSGNAWKKQDCVLETDAQYPRKICFNLFGDNVDKFPVQVGQKVTVSIDLESREFNGRWYTDVRAWNIVYPQAQQVAQPAYQQPQPAPAYQPQQFQQPQPAYPQQQAVAPSPAQAGVADDLPF